MSIPVQITNKTKSTLPRVLFARIKDEALGRDYELSLAIVGTRRMRRINREHRQKDYPTDILSFSLDKKSGEIILNPDKMRIKAKQFGQTYQNYVAFLFIHGLMHLKGFDHGSRMEQAEIKLRKKFDVSFHNEKNRTDHHRD